MKKYIPQKTARRHGRILKGAQRRRAQHPDWLVWAFYKGPLDRDKDRALFKCGGGYSDGSGFDFTTGTRDHNWGCFDERAAIKLAKAIRRKVRGVRVQVTRRVVRWVRVRVPR